MKLTLKEFKTLSNFLDYEKCMSHELYSNYLECLNENYVSDYMLDFCYYLAYDMDYQDYDDSNINNIEELEKFLNSFLENV